MMAKLVPSIFFGILLLQWISAAPSEPVPESATDLKKQDDNEENKPQTLLDETKDTETAQGQRQKRWYNYYGFPPINPVVYNKQDTFPTSGGYGFEDPFVQIHRRLQEISGFVRQPVPPPLPPALPQFPPFFPVLYIPQVGCACTPNNPPTRPVNPPAPPSNNNQTTANPNVDSRWPEMEDERQNWGFVLNDTEVYDDNDADINDGARPISFDPITPPRNMSRPAPPVDRGQGDLSSFTTTTTVPPPPVTTSRLQPPSTCDGAVLSCCHMSQVTYDCFAAQGCPDPSAYGNPCDPSVIIRVIERFREYYNMRNG